MNKIQKIAILLLIASGLTLQQSVAQTAPPIVPNQISGMVGFWDFENSGSLFQSTAGLGSDLVPGGSSGSITAIAGPVTGDNAVSKTVGQYLLCNHGIPANGSSTTRTNQYSLLIDFRMPVTSNWKSFYQTTLANNDDGESFMNPTAHIGVGALGYSASSILPNEWYRLVITVDCGNSIVYYIDGQQWVPGNGDVLNGRFSFDLSGVLFFADENGEDGDMDIAKVILFNRYINSNEVFDLGGYGHNPNVLAGSTTMLPYLQTPTPSSMYISWHSTDTSVPYVTYGTTSGNLSMSSNGTSQNISGNASYRWHTVKLAGLTPNTEYFYKCYSGNDSTTTAYAFKTPALRSTPGQHLRFVVLGDNRTDVTQSSAGALKIAQKLTEKYGSDYHKYVQLICSVGDIVSNGADVSQYANEYFTPFAPLTRNIPSMISIGNHENNSTSFYDYMKYEELTDGYPSPHPYNEKFYQFSLGSAQFLFLNANTLYRVAPQTTWVDDRLNESESNADIDFVFSFTHQPGHSEVWPDGNEAYVQNDLFGVMKTHHKCAFHFDGHSHNYERGIVEMVNSDSTQQHDMRQMLSGGAGSALDRWGMYPNQTNYYEINKSLDIYCWSLFDIDIDQKSYTCETYSFGNTSLPQNNLLVDSFYRKINQPGPLQAHAAGVINSNELVAFPMQGVDSAMTCHFQVTSVPGIYTSPVLERKQDTYDVYGDSGAPAYQQVDLNSGLDIKRYHIQTTDGLTSGQNYAFRTRYKDNNLEWGKWSEEKPFEYSTSTPSAAIDFIGDSLNIPSGYTVHFSDLSGASALAWQWDFNNDGITDSHVQDPSFQYNFPGDYSVALAINSGGSGNTATKFNYIHVFDHMAVRELKLQNEFLQISPNPFRTNTKIKFSLNSSEQIVIEIKDLQGRTLRELHNGILNKGAYEFEWNGGTEKGQRFSPGTYLISVKGPKTNAMRSVVVE